jgi:hypothetical protein
MPRAPRYGVKFVGYLANVIARKYGRDVEYAGLDFVSGAASMHADGGWVIVPKRIDLKPFLESLPKLANELQEAHISGNAQRTRHLFSKAFVEALLEDFREWGAEAIVRVRTETPTAYLRVCATLVPKELKLEHSQAVKALSDEEIERAIEYIQTILAAQAGEAAKVIEGTAEPAALPAPEAQSIRSGLEPKRQRRPNRLVMQAETAVGPRERISRRVPPPSRA